jgi:putative hydrolase of the HAD superfamily
VTALCAGCVLLRRRSRRPVRGVLFDVDDTLVDHSGAQRAAIVDYLASLGLDHDDAAVDRWRAAEERHFSRHLTGELTFQGQRRARVREMLAEHGGAEFDDSRADAWFLGYTTRFEAAWTTYDDVAAALDMVAARGLAVGIVTNVDADHQRRKLEMVGLGNRFDVVVGLDTFGFGKPDARVFRHACELIGTTPTDTVFVGDRLDHDAIGARDAGLRAIWLDRSGTAPSAVPDGVLRVTSLAELEAVVA